MSDPVIPSFTISGDLLKGADDRRAAQAELARLNLLLKRLRDQVQRVAAVTGGLVTTAGGATLRHDQLLELLDDDHTQYLMANGGRALAGNLSVNPLITVDGIDIGEHDHGGGTGGKSVVRIKESGGPTDLTIGAIPDGQFLKRSGAGVVGAAVLVSGSFVDNETPAGLIDGANLAYTLASAPNPSSSLQLFVCLDLTVGGYTFVRQGGDYTLAGNIITYGSALPTGAGHVAFYRV